MEGALEQQFKHRSYGSSITLCDGCNDVLRDYLMDTSSWSWTSDISQSLEWEVDMLAVYRVLAVKDRDIKHTLIVAKDENEARLKVLAPLADEIEDWDVQVVELGRFVREAE